MRFFLSLVTCSAVLSGVVFAKPAKRSDNPFPEIEMVVYLECAKHMPGTKPGGPLYGAEVGLLMEDSRSPGITLYACPQKDRVLFNAENAMTMPQWSAKRSLVLESCKKGAKLVMKNAWPEHRDAVAEVDCAKVTALLKGNSK